MKVMYFTWCQTSVYDNFVSCLHNLRLMSFACLNNQTFTIASLNYLGPCNSEASGEGKWMAEDYEKKTGARSAFGGV